MATLYNPTRDIVKRFDSPEDYAAHLERNCKGYVHDYGGDDWQGYDWNKALRVLREGDLTNVAAAEKIIADMHDANIFSSGIPLPVRSVVGYSPCVPAAITGHPRSMYTRNRSETLSLNSPISIYVETTVSAGVSHSELMSRGIAVLAFAMAMNITRPVSLYTASIGKPNSSSSGSVVRINTSPMDLGRAAYMLTNASYCRQLAFAAMKEAAPYGRQSNYISWPWDMMPRDGVYQASMREMLGMEGDDVLIYGGHLFDDLMRTNPVQWVKDMLAKHSGNQEGE